MNERKKYIPFMILLLLFTFNMNDVSADPIVLSGNTFRQDNTGDITAKATVSNVSNSEIRNNVAGNLITNNGAGGVISNMNITQTNVGNISGELIVPSANGQVINNNVSGTQVVLTP